MTNENKVPPGWDFMTVRNDRKVVHRINRRTGKAESMLLDEALAALQNPLESKPALTTIGLLFRDEQLTQMMVTVDIFHVGGIERNDYLKTIETSSFKNTLVPINAGKWNMAGLIQRFQPPKDPVPYSEVAVAYAISTESDVRFYEFEEKRAAKKGILCNLSDPVGFELLRLYNPLLPRLIYHIRQLRKWDKKLRQNWVMNMLIYEPE